MERRLGLNPSKHDRRTLVFSDYRTKAKITLPPSFGVGAFVPDDGWGMLGNGPDPTVSPDFPGAGDCFFAGRAHGTWATEMVAHGGALPNPFTSLDVLVKNYSPATGYKLSDNPNNPTDKGTDPLTGLKFCRNVGLTSTAVPGVHKLGGFLAIEAGNWTEILEAAFLFGTVGLGFEIPDYAEAEFESRRKWSVRSGGQIEGGHWVEGITYDHVRGLELVTWGSRIQVTKGFVVKYCYAPYALLSTEILTPGGKSPAGFDLPQLQADLVAF